MMAEYKKTANQVFNMKRVPNNNNNNNIVKLREADEDDFVFDYEDLEDECEWEMGLVPNTSNDNHQTYTCEFCDFISEKPGKMKTHLVNSHDAPPLVHRCTYCSYSTSNVHHLKDHVHAKHSNIRPFKCTYCDYDSVTLSNLKRHTFTKHTGDKPNCCPFCDYRSVQTGHLKAHINAKHLVRPSVKCPDCDYTTSQLGHLKRHVSKHVGPRQCPHCSFSTVYSKSLKKHIMIRHTGIRPYHCPHCNHTSAAIGDLNNHIRFKHPGKRKVTVRESEMFKTEQKPAV